MPEGQSRDGTWNTNNWAETVFKQFNAIFLDNKHNKRYEFLKLPEFRQTHLRPSIDRLAHTILHQHLKFFVYFPTPNRPAKKEFIALHTEANRLWEKDMVEAVADAPNSFAVNRFV